MGLGAHYRRGRAFFSWDICLLSFPHCGKLLLTTGGTLFNLVFVPGLLFLFTSQAREKAEMAWEAALFLSPPSHSWFQETGAFTWVPESGLSGSGHFQGYHFGRFLFLLKLLHSWVCGILFTTGDSKSLGLFMTWNNKIGEVATTILSVCCLYVSL